jgi:hypothetical protein
VFFCNTAVFPPLILAVALVFCLSFPHFASAADADAEPLVRKTIFGLLLHDRGPASDRHENGIDPNWELQLKAPQWKLWRWIGAPYPTLGITPNFNGDTSVSYVGITYELELSNRLTDPWTLDVTKKLFVAGGINAAIHNGPLHKNAEGCDKRSDCGFGYRVLPRLSIEIGARFRANHGASLFYDHMSHKGVLGGENEGIDHLGIRYHYSFKPRS